MSEQGQRNKPRGSESFFDDSEQSNGNRNESADSSSRREAPYWQGVYQKPDYMQREDEFGLPSGGTVTPAARQSYASEAIFQKDHVSAGLLAIFLGLFGVHKFYMGCNNAGFIMLAVSIIGGVCTLGLASAVIWLIAMAEGTIYLMKSQNDFERQYVLNRRDWF